MRRAGSPIIRAASAAPNMASRSGAWAVMTGSAPYLRSRMMRASCTDVRELLSTARVRIRAAGRDDTSRMLRAAPWHAIPTPGITSKSCRVNSNDGTMPISAAPDANCSAQPDGTRKSSSKIPFWGPCNIPHTNGVVFKKLTAQTRGLMVGVSWGNPQCNKTPVQPYFRLWAVPNILARRRWSAILLESASASRLPGGTFMTKKYISVLTLVFAGAASAFAQNITLNSVPSRSIGSPALNISSTNPNLVEGREFYYPQGVAVDTSVSPPILYVSDANNNRVLAWKNANSFQSGQFADLAIGQPDLLTTFAGGPGTAYSTGLYRPTGIAVYKGDLYVADSGNNRVLRYPNPFNQVTRQQNPQQFPVPDLWIGQATVNTRVINYNGQATPNAQGIYLTNGSSILQSSIAFDSSGNLWMTDAGNLRVLRFNVSDVANGGGGLTANLELGQNDFVALQTPLSSGNATP